MASYGRCALGYRDLRKSVTCGGFVVCSWWEWEERDNAVRGGQMGIRGFGGEIE